MTRNEKILNRFKKQWLENLEKNIPEIKKYGGIEKIRNTQINKNAIIIGAGASLERNSYLLSEAKEKGFIIISCDKANSKTNYIADYVIAVDSQEIVSDFFEPEKTKEQTLIAISFIHPKVIAKWGGKIKFFNPINPEIIDFFKNKNFKNKTGKLGNIMQLGFVGITCIEFASYLGCENIIMIGMDFMLTYRKRYAFENEISQQELYNNKQYRMIDCFDYPSGFKTKGWIDFSLLGATKIFLNRIHEWKKRNIIVINSTEGGLLKTIFPFKKAIELYGR